MVITHVRQYETLSTPGRLLIAGQALGNTLEDIGRPAGIKIPKETCIPEGSYYVAITESQRFGRRMILLFTNPKTMACEHEGVVFTGIRCHKGVKTEQTEGCILFQGDLTALENQIDEALGRGEKVTWEIGRA